MNKMIFNLGVDWFILWLIDLSTYICQIHHSYNWHENVSGVSREFSPNCTSIIKIAYIKSTCIQIACWSMAWPHEVRCYRQTHSLLKNLFKMYCLLTHTCIRKTAIWWVFKFMQAIWHSSFLKSNLKCLIIWFVGIHNS